MKRARSVFLGWLERLPRPPLFFLLLLAGLTGYYFLRHPILMGDTDLWYHLTGGRYLCTTGTIPHDSFFSFITPPRPWVDYYWLFQALVYGIYRLWAYQGLVIFRAAMYLATLTIVLRLLIQGRHRERSLPWFAFLGACYCLLLIPRSLAVRPHLFSYFFIAAFLYLLELAPQRAVWLPLLGLLWCNLHGITYPVLELICGAHLVEWLIASRASRATRVPWPRPSPPMLIATMLTPLLTPHSLDLLKMPLISTDQASLYIKELQRFALDDLLAYRLTLGSPTPGTCFNLLVVMVALAFLAALSHRPWRVSHLLLGVGGAVLLTKGMRFIYEFALLGLPLLRAHPLIPTGGLTKQVPKPVYLAVTALLMIMPVLFVLYTFQRRPAYPFSRKDLPVGITRCLRQWDVGDRVLNHPDTGGFLQWELYPRYRIFMDMQVPFLFTDEDIYLSREAFSDTLALRRALVTYRPSFIAVPEFFHEFPDLIKRFPAYVPVCMDDTAVLYVNAKRHADIADRYALQHLEPFRLLHEEVETILKETKDRPALLAETQRLLTMDPEGIALNELAAEAYQQDGAFARMLPHAATLIRVYPEETLGYRLRGEALAGLGHITEALASYQQALERASAHQTRTIVKAMGTLEFTQGRYKDAYTHLRAVIEPYALKTSRDELLQLAQAARLAGRRAEAQRLVQYLWRYRTGPQETAWIERVRQEYAQLGLPWTGPSSQESHAQQTR